MGLIRIGEARIGCSACGWRGTVADAEPDVDGDGSLECPKCGQVLFTWAPECPQVEDPEQN